MKKAETKAATPYWDTAQSDKPTRTPIGTLRIAKVVYEHHPVEADSPGYSIGQLIDRRITESLDSGSLVSEVSLFFETAEQQHEVARMYAERG